MASPSTLVTPSPRDTAGRPEPPPAIAFDHVSFAFDDHVVLDDVSFVLPHGGLTVLLGASGSGKSVTLKLMLGLLRPDAGAIVVDGQRIDRMSEREMLHLRGRIGMLFQDNALFDSLTVSENVGFRMFETGGLPRALAQARVDTVLDFIGLAGLGDRLPSQLSGGQRRRVAMARAIADRPTLLLLDDPTSGLDPITASRLDDEIVKLRDLEHVTSVVATHQVRDAFYVAEHRVTGDGTNPDIRPAGPDDTATAGFMILHQGRVYFTGSADQLRRSDDPFVRQFLYKTLPPW